MIAVEKPTAAAYFSTGIRAFLGLAIAGFAATTTLDIIDQFGVLLCRESLTLIFATLFFSGVGWIGIVRNADWHRPYLLGALATVFATERVTLIPCLAAAGLIAVATVTSPNKAHWRQALVIAWGSTLVTLLATPGFFQAIEIASGDAVGSSTQWLMIAGGFGLATTLFPLLRGRTWPLLILPFIAAIYAFLGAEGSPWSPFFQIISGLTLLPIFFYIRPILRVLLGRQELNGEGEPRDRLG